MPELPPFPHGPLLPPADRERLRMARMGLDGDRRSVPDRRAAERPTGDRRRQGRPSIPADQRKDETLHIRLSPDLYDRVWRIAQREELPVTVVARQLITRELARLEAVSE